MSFFITGASGFIGQNLIKLLDGNILILSRNQHPHYKTIVCDLEREVIPENALNGVDTVFHLAGFAHDTRDKGKNSNIHKKINVDATVKLARLAVRSHVKKFVFVSSVKAGGPTLGGECASEEMQGNPDGSYGKTKRDAELILLDIAKKSDMHLSILRPSLVYGPNVKGNLALMFSGIKKGWFPPLPETGNKKSMIHVDDLVRAILLVSDDNRANGEIFIATDFIPHSSREIYNAMRVALGKSVPRWSVPKFLFDMISLINPRIEYKLNKLLGDECYSSSKLEALGFKPQKTLKDMNETSF